jgi:4a-hydroxytetrahydrobiopterin dehydratase
MANGRSTLLRRLRSETMSQAPPAQLAGKHCVPCEGGIPSLKLDQANKLLVQIPQWRLTGDAKRIRREWRVKDFATAIDFFGRIAQIADQEDHHPDLHLTGYRDVAVELTTHAIKGLSENDFILAAKIDQLPVELKK